MKNNHGLPPGHLNPIIKVWAKDTLGALKTNVTAMGAVDTKKLVRTLKTRHSVRDNDIWKTAFIMPLHGVMVEHGAGSGWKNGRKIGHGSGPHREARPWFSDAMNKLFPDLADSLTKAIADHQQKAIADIPLPGHRTGVNNYRVNISL